VGRGFTLNLVILAALLPIAATARGEETLELVDGFWRSGSSFGWSGFRLEMTVEQVEAFLGSKEGWQRYGFCSGCGYEVAGSHSRVQLLFAERGGSTVVAEIAVQVSDRLTSCDPCSVAELEELHNWLDIVSDRVRRVFPGLLYESRDGRPEHENHARKYRLDGRLPVTIFVNERHVTLSQGLEVAKYTCF